jgi:hypothetical protein
MDIWGQTIEETRARCGQLKKKKKLLPEEEPMTAGGRADQLVMQGINNTFIDFYRKQFAKT